MADDNTPRSREPAGTNWRSTLSAVGPYLGLGVQLAVTMAAFAGIGYLLDRWLGSMPWGMLAASALGLVAVFVQLARTMRKMNASSRSDDASR